MDILSIVGVQGSDNGTGTLLHLGEHFGEVDADNAD